MAETPEDKIARQPYAAPRLQVIELAAREVLAIGCKTMGGGNNAGIEPCPLGGCASPDPS